jgi:SPP1 family predicted phage head-tail adaptor
MRDRIQLRSRVITPPTFGTAAPTEEYALIAEVWAKAETLTQQRAKAMFNEVNIEQLPAHLFTIRYRSDVTAETVITFRDENYDITGTIRPDERIEYLELGCRILGDKDKGANQ